MYIYAPMVPKKLTEQASCNHSYSLHCFHENEAYFLPVRLKKENEGYLFIVLTDYTHSFLKKFENCVGSTIKTINLNNI